MSTPLTSSLKAKESLSPQIKELDERILKLKGYIENEKQSIRPLVDDFVYKKLIFIIDCYEELRLCERHSICEKALLAAETIDSLEEKNK